MKCFTQFMLLIGLTFFSWSSASALDVPRGPVILTLTGAISQPNSSGTAVLDTVMLRSLPQQEIVTDTPWTEGDVHFEGPLLRDVLKLVGAQGNTLKAMALNDYFVDIPALDAERYRVILAMRMDGKELTVRTKGPLWVIYPWRDKKELRSETYYSRSIWQLSNIFVQ